MSGFAKLRRKLAGYIVGEQFAAYTPKACREILNSQDWSKLSDAELAFMARVWFQRITQSTVSLADARDIPLSVFTTSQAVMTLIRYARDLKSEVTTFTQNGSIAGDDIGNWQLVLTHLSDDYEFGPMGVEQDVAEDGRITRLSYGFRLPEVKP